MNVVSNTSEFTADVLRVVNKIMEGSVRCQEELTMMGECSFHLLSYMSCLDMLQEGLRFWIILLQSWF